jgi:diguanylate cyclase (GGDEF)-like protein
MHLMIQVIVVDMEKISQSEQDISTRQIIQEIHRCNENASTLHHIDPKKGLIFAAKAYDLSLSGPFTQNPYVQGQADSLLNMSYFNYLFGKMQLALDQAEQCMQLYQTLGQYLPQVEVYAHLGLIFDTLDDRTNAIEYLVRGLDLAKTHHFELAEGKILFFIGKTYLTLGNYRQSMHTTLQAEVIFKKYKDQIFQAYALISLAEAYAHLSQSEKAFNAIHQSLDLSVSGGYFVIQSVGFYRLGMMHLAHNEIELAKTHLRYSHRLAKKTQFMPIYVCANLGLGDILMSQNETGLALKSLKKSLYDAESIHIDQLILEAHQKLAALYETLHRFKLSLHHYKAYSEITNKIFDEQSQQKIQTVEVIYRTRAAKREVELTRNENLALENEITERKKLEAELHKSKKRYRYMASFDPLTKLYNRRQFFALAEIEFERAKRYQHPLSVLLIDLDHFKLVNDHYGHLIGDEMLEFVANISKQIIRKIDIIGRYGGEEFIILLPQTDVDQAVELAQRICTTIENSVMPCAKGSVVITASIGVGVTNNQYCDRLETLLEMADKAMYMAKQKGRNQVCLNMDAPFDIQ